MDDNNIQGIIFDLGNVLVDFDHMIAAKRISAFAGEPAQEIFELFFDSRITALFEEGKITPLDFFREIKNMLNLKLGYDEFLPIWNEIFFFTENNRKIYNLAKFLKSRYKIALLSNINVLHYDYLKKNFPVFDVFQKIITSFEIGVRKPSPLIYEKTLGSLGTKAENTFYTDDREELVKAACALGIRGFVFKGVQGLRQDLLDNSININ